MRDYIDLGPTPADEECTQVGSREYTLYATEECDRYIRLIRKKLGPEPEGAKLAIKRNAHDFGTYLTVVCRYDDNLEDSVKYVFRCESDAPTKWEDEEV